MGIIPVLYARELAKRPQPPAPPAQAKNFFFHADRAQSREPRHFFLISRVPSGCSLRAFTVASSALA
jgi:hypothetical protein